MERKVKKMVKGAKSIAEYAIRRWLSEQGFDLEYFKLFMDGNRSTLTDKNGEGLVLVYDPGNRVVYVAEN